MNLLIVGNGPSISQFAAHQIDSFSGHILRMNNFVPGENAGFRYDIFCSNMWLDIQRRDLPSAVQIWCARPNLRYNRQEKCMELFRRYPDLTVDDDLYKKTHSQLKAHPTTGLVAILMARTQARYENVYLAGFDFFRGDRQHYFSHAPIHTTHKPKRERKMLARIDHVFDFADHWKGPEEE
ncbi:MAG: hypothetical protein HKM89_01805 [Gemmatimonadales bacterium]|nr:hypothetical protein [Gemmatimonadales bacterium]